MTTERQSLWRRGHRALAPWLIPPASGWQHKGGGIRGSRLFVPLVGTATSVILLGVLALAAAWEAPGLLFFTALVLGVGAVWIAALVAMIRNDLFLPLAHLRNWAMRARGGNLAARIPEPEGGDFAALARDINGLSESLQDLSRDMEGKVRRQTERIAQKSASLKILYDVAASINGARDVEELVTRFLHVLKDVTNARAGTVRLLTDDNQMRLVASTGLDERFLRHERLVSVERCLCGSAVMRGEVCDGKATGCEQHIGQPLFGGADVEVVAVPLEYRDRKLGVYNLFIGAPALSGREDLRELLTSIGQHLGVAIEKARLDEEARRLSILEERTLLAHELHDSLAQTLASLRFHASSLEDALNNGQEDPAAEAQRLRLGIGAAYRELRDLIAQFRSPMEQRGVVPSLEHLITRFRKETGITVFVQSEWHHVELPADVELQVLRIAQEALCNIRKHSEARTVRVLLRHSAERGYQMLIEDDGVGMAEPFAQPCDPSASAGEHIGLAVMQERAERFGGTLSIESERGEGTRLLLTFQLPSSTGLAMTGPSV